MPAQVLMHWPVLRCERMNKGTLFGVGVGPGAHDLLTVRATKVLKKAKLVAYFAKKGEICHAYETARPWLAETAERLPMYYPVTTEISRTSVAYQQLLAQFYESQSARLKKRLNQGEDIVIISEGDPLFYGSFMHLCVRLQADYPIEVVPGISAASGSWSMAKLPICQGEDVLGVLPGTLSSEKLIKAINFHDALVIMKVGRHLKKVREALAHCERLSEALYVEYATLPQAQFVALSDVEKNQAPYFSLILVPGLSAQNMARAPKGEKILLSEG